MEITGSITAVGYGLAAIGGGIGVGLHPLLQRLGAVQGTHRVHIQQLFGTFYAGARFDL